MNNNLNEQIKYLEQSIPSLLYNGFHYGPKEHESYVRPNTFTFDNINPQRSNSRKSAISSLSSIGMIDLVQFRKNTIEDDKIDVNISIVSKNHTNNMNYRSVPTIEEKIVEIPDNLLLEIDIDEIVKEHEASISQNRSYVSSQSAPVYTPANSFSLDTTININNNGVKSTSSSKKDLKKRKLELENEINSLTGELCNVNSELINYVQICTASAMKGSKSPKTPAILKSTLKTRRDEIEKKLDHLLVNLIYISSDNSIDHSLHHESSPEYVSTHRINNHMIHSIDLNNSPILTSNNFRRDSDPINDYQKLSTIEPKKLPDNPFRNSFSSSSWNEVPEVISEQTSMFHDHSFNTLTTKGEGNPLCLCGLPSLLATSRKETSEGKQFYACRHPRDSPQNCKYFAWLDETFNPNNSFVNNNYTSITSDSLPAGVIKDHRIEIKSRFGHRDFRHGQLACVEAALKGRDVFCLMPTGGGKSVVYQLPAWCCAGVAIVFSPLISLIQDQVDAMNAIGIRAVFMSSTQDTGEVQMVVSELRGYCHQPMADASDDENLIKMLYITPEKFNKSKQLRDLLSQLANKSLLSRFIIDEAHCLSQWGHDFRPDYLALSQIRQNYPKVPIMCLTATANQGVVRDCMKIMRLSNPFEHKQSFNRHNLLYFVKKKESDKKLIADIAEYVMARRRQSGIIYCLSKRDTEYVASELMKALPVMKNQVTFYHADVTPALKEDRQRKWSKGDIKVICATIAFGMGINKPDVRYVIHHSLPKSLTNYYQESGRAGRDGDTAECVLYFSYKDKTKLTNMIMKPPVKSGDQPNVNSHETIKLGLENLNRCVSYCMNEVDCRRVLLLQYFGEEFPHHMCKQTCDNCKRNAEHDQTITYQDMTMHAIVVICIVQEMLQSASLTGNNTNKLTLLKLAKLYSGSKDKELQKFEAFAINGKRNALVYQRPTEPGGSDGSTMDVKDFQLPRDVSERLIQVMVLENYLREEQIASFDRFSADYITMGNRSEELLIGKAVLKIPMKSKPSAVAVQRKVKKTKASEASTAGNQPVDLSEFSYAESLDDNREYEEEFQEHEEYEESRPVKKDIVPSKTVTNTKAAIAPMMTARQLLHQGNQDVMHDDDEAHQWLTTATKSHSLPNYTSSKTASSKFKPPYKTAAPISTSMGSDYSPERPPPTSKAVIKSKKNLETSAIDSSWKDSAQKSKTSKNFGLYSPNISMQPGTGRGMSTMNLDHSPELLNYSDNEKEVVLGKGPVGKTSSIWNESRKKKPIVIVDEDDEDEAEVDHGIQQQALQPTVQRSKGPSTDRSDTRQNLFYSKAIPATQPLDEIVDVDDIDDVEDAEEGNPFGKHTLSEYFSKKKRNTKTEEFSSTKKKQKPLEREEDHNLLHDRYDLSKNGVMIDGSPEETNRIRSQFNATISPNHIVLTASQRYDLQIWLQEYRKIFDRYWNYLSDKSVREITLKIPSTISELAMISEIGDIKAKKYGAGILATIYAFLESKELLHMFPLLSPPTIPECPTWRNPCSEEAMEVRTIKQISQNNNVNNNAGGAFQSNHNYPMTQSFGGSNFNSVDISLSQRHSDDMTSPPSQHVGMTPDDVNKRSYNMDRNQIQHRNTQAIQSIGSSQQSFMLKQHPTNQNPFHSIKENIPSGVPTNIFGPNDSQKVNNPRPINNANTNSNSSTNSLFPNFVKDKESFKSFQDLF